MKLQCAISLLRMYKHYIGLHGPNILKILQTSRILFPHHHASIIPTHLLIFFVIFIVSVIYNNVHNTHMQ